MDNFSSMEKSRHILEYLSIIRKRIWVVVAMFVVVVSLSVLWNVKATPMYQATVQILIEPVNPRVVAFDEIADQNFGHSRYGDYYATQYKLLRGNTLARQTVRALNLTQEGSFGLRRNGSGPFSSLDHVLSDSAAWALRYARGLGEPFLDMSQADSGRPSISPEDIAVKRILEGLDIEPVKGTRLVKVHYESQDPAVAVKIANKLSELYLEMNLRLRFDMNQNASKWLENEIESTRKALMVSEQKLQRYKEKFNLVSLEDRQNIVTQKLKELNSTYTKARTETLGIEVLVRKIRSINGDAGSLDSLPIVMDNPVLQGLRATHIALQREHSDLSKRYKSGHPKLIRLNSRLRLMEKKIKSEIRKLTDNILARYQVARAREMSLKKSLENQKKESLQLNRLAISFRSLKRGVDTNQEIYLELLKRSKETGLMGKLRTSNIRIVEKAKLPTNPVRPRRMRNIVFAMSASLFFGIVLTFFVDHLDRRLRTPEDAGSISGAPLLGVIPDLNHKLSAKGNSLLMRDNDTTILGNQSFREAGIMAASRLGETPKVILVTSCLPGEGKTFVASNLALTMSKTGKTGSRVLLIEGDLHRPGFGEMFGNIPSGGLSQVLRGNADMGEAIRRFPHSTLGILPAGNVVGEPSTLLIQSGLVKLIEPMKAHFDYIFIDTPPLLSVSDPLVWSSCADGAFLVVDMKQVKPEMLQKAVSKLRSLDVPVLGTIPNRVSGAGDYYYGGYDNYSG